MESQMANLTSENQSNHLPTFDYQDQLDEDGRSRFQNLN